MADWSRIVNTTIHKYIREQEINVLRNRKLLALLKSRGRITMNGSGDLLDWKVRYKRAPMQGYADSDILTFSRRDRWKTAQLPYRGYAATDQMTKLERLKNKNTEAIVKVYSEITDLLMEDIEDQFGDEFYIDGSAAGNGKRMHGILSFLGYSAAGTKYPVGRPNSTYAGLVCTLANYGGSWSTTGTTTTDTDWPTGVGDSHYDFWAPLIVDYTSAIATSSAAGTVGWAASTKTWPNTCQEALRFGIIKGKKNKSKKGMLDVISLNDELYRLFCDKEGANERLTVRRGEASSGLYALGFTDVVNFDGVDITSEYGIPTAEGYGWSIDNMELVSMQPNLFVPEGPMFDMSTQSWRFSIDMFGNIRYNPRYFVRFKNIT